MACGAAAAHDTGAKHGQRLAMLDTDRNGALSQAEMREHRMAKHGRQLKG